MLLHDLPEDILTIVLQRCVRASDDPTKALKPNLPLLAVCRLWRRLAIPLVYNQVFVRYGEQPKLVTCLPIHHHDAEEPTDAVVKTNLDLVAMVGCAHAVKRVKIDVWCLANPFPGWREVIQRMRAVASKWRAVELTVAMHPDFRHFDGRNADMDKYTDDITEIGDALAALMPDVRQLKCEVANQNPIARSLYGYLASHYADQLQRLDSEHPITPLPDCQFTRLNEVIIDCNGVADYQLPQMASKELVSVKLVNGPANHSWAPFSADSDSRVIEFTKLKGLSVAYYRAYQENGVVVRHRDEQPWQLQFPSLRSLYIHSTQDICPLLRYAVLPPRMESITIELRSAAFQDIADLVLPATKCLSVSIDMLSLGDPSGLPAINRILDSARGSEIVELMIEDVTLPVAPDSITCTTLTHLEIRSPTSVDTMLAIIARLPNLAKLTLIDLDLSDIRADISILDPDADAVVEPLSQSLNGLALNYDTRRHSPDTAVAVVKYVLLRIPSLAQLFAIQTPDSPVLDFVEAYAPRHPHLRSVTLNLDVLVSH